VDARVERYGENSVAGRGAASPLRLLAPAGERRLVSLMASLVIVALYDITKLWLCSRRRG
jgi:hypothetical protein